MPFSGLETDVDPTFVSETANVNGQNTFVNEGDRISTRPFGLQIFPSTATRSVVASGVPSCYTFRLRTGENILLRAYGTVLEWFDETSQTWANLRSSLSSVNFGFAEFNVNANAESRLYHGNGVDNFAYWNGGHTNLTGALVGGEATINVTSTSSFSATGTIRIGTTDVTYSGVTATSFTGCAGTPAASNGDPVAQAVTTDGSAPKGNVYMAANNRLFIVPAINKQIVQFSKYGDASSWSTNTVTSATADSAGAFNLIEGGGEVTAMAQDEQSLYFLKDACTYKATLSDALYSIELLKPFDGRSRATGAVAQRGVFSAGNIIFVVTPDNQIKALERVETIDYPQFQPISEPIQPTCDNLDFSSLAGIAFRNYAYIACKSSPEVDTNDTVLVYNLVKGHWESPIVGWQVGEWAIYDSGSGNNLYFGDAVSPNMWKLITSTITDGDVIVTSSWTSKEFTFGSPTEQKQLADLYLEGYITGNTALNVELFYDEGGTSGILETEISGSETDFLFNTADPNTLGLTPFGTERFGSNNDQSGKVKFRVHLRKNLRAIPSFYTLQLRFSSSGENQQWEVVRIGFLVRTADQPTRTSLMRNW
jgi:hypothetical protein